MSEVELQAGQELDCDIEERFFGLVGRDEPAPYSTDGSTALLLLNKLHAEGWFWRLDSVPNGVICTIQCLTPNGKDPKNPERKTFQVGAATLPLAICLTALKTKS